MTIKPPSKADQVAALRLARASANPTKKENNHASDTDSSKNKVRNANPERRNVGLSVQGTDSPKPIAQMGRGKDLSGGAGQVPINSTSPVKRGRPRIGEIRPKPWLECDPPMSKSSWYRRLREQRK